MLKVLKALKRFLAQSIVPDPASDDCNLEWTGTYGKSRLRCMKCDRGLTDDEVSTTYFSDISYHTVESHGSARCSRCGSCAKWDYTDRKVSLQGAAL